ncbi:MAG: SGNH/GDSL hydrolase family protein [Pseudobutyrivibrio sp.]|nr:SGNH/GDSL hydrolase family protein [Pseudobutyrivibrio sp.]
MKKFIKSLFTTIILLIVTVVAFEFSHLNTIPSDLFKTNEESVSVTPTPVPMTTDSYKEQKNENEIEVNGQAYTITPLTITMYAFDDFDLYPTPDDSQNCILKIYYNDSVDVTGEVTIDDASWYKITSGDYTGFVQSEMLMDEPITLPIPYPAVMPQPATQKDILFIGNSITIYPATEDWWGETHGMGSSSMDKDWVHLTVAATGKGAYDVTSLRTWEFSKERNNELTVLEPLLSANKYSYTVIMLGENCNAHLYTLTGDMCDLVKYIKAFNPDTKVVLIDNFWASSTLTSVKKNVCSSTGADFIDLSAVSSNPDYQWKEGDIFTTADGREYTINRFLAKHPNDAGYQAIADQVIAYFNR